MNSTKKMNNFENMKDIFWTPEEKIRVVLIWDIYK